MNWEHYKGMIKENGCLDEDCYILGIDLGTTNSVISYWNSKMKRPEPIDVSNGFGKVPLPSVVQFRDDEDGAGEWVIGEEALHTVKMYPKTTIQSIKRLMGTRDKVMIGHDAYTPEEISGILLKHLIGHVSSMNPKMQLAGVVVSVPYDFDDAAKKATVKACHLAGLADSLICLIEEPKAAALAYNFRHDLATGERVMVFDFGGGTLDITLFQVDCKDDDAIHMKVISEGGEAYHGGDHIDAMIYEQLLHWLEEKTGNKRNDLSNESVAELYQRANEAKERLSGVAKHRIPFTFCLPPFVQSMSRTAMEDLIQAFIIKTKQLVLDTLNQGYIGPIPAASVTRVLLEGGSSKMPWVKEMLKDIFDDGDKIYVSEQPALDISIGATYYAAMKLGLLDHKDMTTIDKRVQFETPVPHDIGFEVAYETHKGFFPMIRRGTPYALAKKTMVFTLKGDSVEDMTSLDLRILERLKMDDDIEDCKLVGDVRVEGLPERPEGKTKLEVTLTVNETEGTIKGKVRDLGYGRDYVPTEFDREFVPERGEKKVIGV